MSVAIPLLMLVALVGLGSLAAIVFGIVYAIVNKRPGLALGSILVPVVGFFGVALLAMMFWGSRARMYADGPMQAEGPIQVNWTAGPSIPPMPAMPSMPAMPPMPGPPATIALAKIGLIALVCFALIAIFRKGSSCAGKPRRGSKIAVMTAMALAVMFAMRSARHSSHMEIRPTSLVMTVESAPGAAEAQQTIDEQIRRDQAETQQRAAEVQRLVEEANDKAAKALAEGKNFQEMFEKLNKPRIKLVGDEQQAAMSAGGETVRAPEISTGDGSREFVVPISERTQESLARSAERLEQMVEQVADVADQVSDVGTLLGKAMVALNERIDSRPKAVAEPAPLPAARVNVAVPAKHVSTAAVVTKPAETPTNEIVVGGDNESTIVVKLDRHLLEQSGLSFEKLKEQLSREGMWNGKVVRFDEEKLQIAATGSMADDYLPRLTSTLLTANGLHGKSVHLDDLAEVEVAGAIAVAPIHNQTRPAWVDEQPTNMGDVRRDLVVTEEYSSREECERAADVLLLLKTYEHLSQILGHPRSEQPLPSLTFYTETGEIAADGVTVYRRHGKYGEWLDYRLKMLADMGVGIDFVRREMVAQNGEFYEMVERSAGPMQKLYTRLEFRRNVNEELERRWNELRRGERFAVVGAGAGSVLGLLGAAFGLLKVDTWTKGYYTKRLFLGVPAAIIGILALLGLAAG